MFASFAGSQPDRAFPELPGYRRSQMDTTASHTKFRRTLEDTTGDQRTRYGQGFGTVRHRRAAFVIRHRPAYDSASIPLTANMTAKPTDAGVQLRIVADY
jgi:hypothetical protein